ncbi:H/ACA ribonucleoprotein complex subunit 2-like protein [Argonauta hians]
MEEDDKTSVWIKKISHVSPIAQPLASRKLAKRINKVIKKASKTKSLRKGVREVQKFIRRGEKGVVILAGDISPIDIYSHIPIMCEDNQIPYCYVPSKEDLGAACGTIRPVSLIMINKNTAFEEIYTELKDEVKSLPIPI